MVMAHQRLQHRQVHPGLGQGGAILYLYRKSQSAW